MIVSEPVVRETALRALSKVAPAEAAAIQTDLLVEAELRGLPSHGLLRLPRLIARIQNGAITPQASGTHDWRRDAFLSVDGGQGLGPVVAESAIAALSERVARTGIAVAAIRNSNHIGMLAYYSEKAARAGLTMIALSTSEALVHPWGGRRAMLGTNPISIGVPTGGEPFVMDTATSIVPMGKIHDHANRNAPIPLGWAVDGEGNATTDAHAAKAGAIAPFGGAKGYALGLAFELLVSSLAGSAIGRDVKGTLDDTSICSKGDLFILIDGPRYDLVAYLEAIRATEPAEGVEQVLIPGERGRATRAKLLVDGIPVADEVWARVAALAA